MKNQILSQKDKLKAVDDIMDKKDAIKTGFTTNYIRLFNAIYETNSLSEAAKILDIAQPSATNGLNKVRELCDDPLFTKSGHKLIPNHRATRLYTIWKETINTLDKGLNDESLNPPSHSEKKRAADILVAYSSDLNSVIEPTIIDSFHKVYQRKNDRLSLFSYSAYRSNTYKIPTKKNSMPADIIISTKEMDHLVGWKKYVITGFPILVITPKHQNPHVTEEGNLIDPGRDIANIVMTSDALYTATPYLEYYKFLPRPSVLMDNSRAALSTVLDNSLNLLMIYSPKIDSLLETAKKTHRIDVLPEILSKINIYSQTHISENVTYHAQLIVASLKFLVERSHNSLTNQHLNMIFPESTEAPK